LIDEILKTRIAEVRRTLQRTSLARLRREDQQPGLIDPESAWNSVAIYLPELDKAVLNVVQKSWEFLESGDSICRQLARHSFTHCRPARSSSPRARIRKSWSLERTRCLPSSITQTAPRA